MLRAQNLLTAVKLESLSTANGAPTPPPNQNPHLPAIPMTRPLLSVSTPTWIVRAESNVLKERRKKPDPPCVICEGSGRVDCHDCQGKGRTNSTHLTILPKGEWPKWCRTCGGSGLGYCSRCLGTGEHRYIVGFQFMMDRNNQCINPKEPQVQVQVPEEEEETQSLTNLLQTDEPMDSSNEKTRKSASKTISWENIFTGVIIFSLLTHHPSIHG